MRAIILDTVRSGKHVCNILLSSHLHNIFFRTRCEKRLFLAHNFGAYTTGITPHILKCEPGWTGPFCDEPDGSAFMTITSSFKDPTNFEGWNCGKITTCGKFGNICGGFNAKAKSHDITKTFTVSAGTYAISLDFIKIDSWLVFCFVLRCVVGNEKRSKWHSVLGCRACSWCYRLKSLVMCS